MATESRKIVNRILGAVFILLAALFFIATVDCAPAGGRVTGTVKLGGKLLTAGNVHFVNTGANVRVNATINQDGTYETFLADGRKLPVGQYQIAVTPPIFEMPIDADPATVKPPETVDIPQQYQDPATSNLTFTVASGENEFNINLP